MYKNFLIIIISLIWLSCEEEINFPFQQENKVQLNALLGKDSLFKFYFTDNNKYENIKMFLIDDYVNYPILKIKGEQYGIQNFYTAANKNYKIEIHLDDTVISAETQIPEKVYIDSVYYDDFVKYFTLRFYDNPIEKNYYMILIRSNFSSSIHYTSNSKVFKGNLDKDSYEFEKNVYYGSCVFTDESFDADFVDINIDKPVVYNGEFYVDLYHISESYYKYERAYTASKNIGDVPSFSEKKIYSNLKGAEGIFASYAVDSKLIVLY